MSPAPLFSVDRDFEARAVSPLLEMGAYEALWDEPGASFKSLAALFESHPGSTPSELVDRGRAERYAEEALAIIRKADVAPFGVRVHGAGEYPLRLREARHPIELLYFQGWWDLVEGPSVAVVGTRKPTADAVARTHKIARLLVEDGFTVVSGLAAGIDTEAHKTAIAKKGRTIAVIGTPISDFYPPENEKLQRFIASEFLVVSQIPVVRYNHQTFRGNRLFFPERNITMSALTSATIIVEASDTSGTMHQARAAIEQGRKLFILDSCFRNPAITWPRKMEALGGIRVAEYADIRAHLDHPRHRG